MLIKSLIQREGGSEISLGDVVYHFAPNTSGDHVCEVDDKGHIALLLAIEEGYAEADAASAKPAGKKDKA